jgi:hypothetical protein
MPNQRIFYASHAVTIGGSVVQGAQSVSVNTNFNLEQVFQLGRLAIYDNIATDPDVEVTVSKTLDGHSTIWNLFCDSGKGNSLVEQSLTQKTIVLHVDDETQPAVGGASTAAIQMTGCFVSSLSYTFPVDGDFIEDLSFVGSHKAAISHTITAPNAAPDPKVLRRQNFRYHGEGGTVLPTEVRNKKLSSVSISADLGREKMFSLGQVSPFHRFVNFPLEITVSFDVIQDGTNSNQLVGPNFDEITARCSGAPINTQPIKFVLCDANGSDAYTFDLGSGCSLQSVSYSGGDTGGGNVTETYTYITYNELTVTTN